MNRSDHRKPKAAGGVHSVSWSIQSYNIYGGAAIRSVVIWLGTGKDTQREEEQRKETGKSAKKKRRKRA